MKKIILACTIITISVIAFFYKTEIFSFVQYIEEITLTNPLLSAFILIVLKTISAPLGFPGTPLTLIAGSLFGNIWGTLIALVGNTLGATLAFLLARYVLRDYIQEKFVSKYPKINECNKSVEKRGFPTVISLRLIPLFPFNALNFLLGITKIPTKTYIIASFIGMIPGTFLFVYFGESLRMLSWVNILLALLGIIILTYIGKLYEKKYK